MPTGANGSSDAQHREHSGRFMLQKATSAVMQRHHAGYRTMGDVVGQVYEGNRALGDAFRVQDGQICGVAGRSVHHGQHPAIILAVCILARHKDGLLATRDTANFNHTCVFMTWAVTDCPQDLEPQMAPNRSLNRNY